MKNEAAIAAAFSFIFMVVASIATLFLLREPEEIKRAPPPALIPVAAKESPRVSPLTYTESFGSSQPQPVQPSPYRTYVPGPREREQVMRAVEDWALRNPEDWK